MKLETKCNGFTIYYDSWDTGESHVKKIKNNMERYLLLYKVVFCLIILVERCTFSKQRYDDTTIMTLPYKVRGDRVEVEVHRTRTRTWKFGSPQNSVSNLIEIYGIILSATSKTQLMRAVYFRVIWTLGRSLIGLYIS